MNSIKKIIAQLYTCIDVPTYAHQKKKKIQKKTPEKIKIKENGRA